MIKQVFRTQKESPTAQVELQHIYFENRRIQNQSGLDIDSPEYKIHSKLVNLLYDMNNWHFPHDFKRKEDRLETMIKWMGNFNFQTILEGNRESYVWAVDINGTIYEICLTPLGLFVQTEVGTEILKVYKDMKELSLILLQNWKKK